MTSTRNRNTPNPLCSPSSCADDQNEESLTCSKCNRLVHYICTRLPPYMIAVCKDGRRTANACKYVCQNCVKVTKDLLVLSPQPGPQPSLRTAAELAKLNETIKENEKTIKKLKSNEQHLLEIIESQKKELTNLEKKLSNDPAFHTVEYVESKLEKKLETFRTEILTSLKEECKKSYAAATSANVQVPNDNIKTAVKEVHEEEAAEERDKIRRSKNIIIHGVEDPTTEDATKKDEAWVKTLIEKLHVKINIKYISRIGKSVDGKKRPLIVTLNSEEEKMNVFGNLPALKGIDAYKGMSICEDLTPAQRKKYKEAAEDAKARNQTEKDGVWRVRGFAKNGFGVKKINAKDRQ